MNADVEVVYECSPSDRCYEIIEASSWVNTQVPGADLDSDALGQAALAGAVLLYRHQDIVVCLSAQTAWVGRVDIFAPPGSSFYACVKALRSFLNWAIGNTHYERLEARSPHRFISTIGTRVGGKLDAVIPHSFRGADGEMQDEYLVGWTRPRSMQWHQ